MKINLTIFLFSAAAIASLHATPTEGTGTVKSVSIPTIDLRELLKSGAPKLPLNKYKLEPEWIGTMTPVVISRKDRPELFRPDEEPNRPERSVARRLDHIYSMRLNLHGFEQGSIPSLTELKAVKTYAGLRKMGMNEGGSAAGGGGASINFSSYGMTTKGELILTRVSGAYSTSDRDGTIFLLNISRGVFHPANPDSKEERLAFPSDEEKQAHCEALIRKRANDEPEPIRSFWKAVLTSNEATQAFVADFKKNPNQQLISQLVARIHGGREVSLSREEDDDAPMPHYFGVNGGSTMAYPLTLFLGDPYSESAMPPRSESRKMIRLFIEEIPLLTSDPSGYIGELNLPQHAGIHLEIGARKQENQHWCSQIKLGDTILWDFNSSGKKDLEKLRDSLLKALDTNERREAEKQAARINSGATR
jgi:hypothetical protein